MNVDGEKGGWIMVLRGEGEEGEKGEEKWEGYLKRNHLTVERWTEVKFNILQEWEFAGCSPDCIILRKPLELICKANIQRPTHTHKCTLVLVFCKRFTRTKCIC